MYINYIEFFLIDIGHCWVPEPFSTASGSRLWLPIKKTRLMGAFIINFFYRLRLLVKRPSSSLLGVVFRVFTSYGSLLIGLPAPAPFTFFTGSLYIFFPASAHPKMVRIPDPAPQHWYWRTVYKSEVSN